MSLLLETTIGDITIDLDLASPNLCRNILKLAKARYYTNTLVYNVQQGRFAQLGDPKADGTGGCSIFGLIDSLRNTDMTNVVDITKSKKRFIRSEGRYLNPIELSEKGRVVATEIGDTPHTIGSQFLITVDSGEGKALDGFGIVREMGNQKFLSLGKVVEDEDGVLDQINSAYCDKSGRPYADIRLIRMHILDDPFDDPDEMCDVLSSRGVTLISPSDLPDEFQECSRFLACSSPDYKKPLEEQVETRIGVEELMTGNDGIFEEKREEEAKKKEDKSRSVVLEMLGDINSADDKPPENVLFVCKLNSVTVDDDLELIFSRFDTGAKAEIIRDPDTGESLQYAFIEFTTKEQCSEAYFKMNNALVDDRRIKVDFSQSVAKKWNKYRQQRRGGGSHNKGSERGRYDNKSMNFKNRDKDDEPVRRANGHHEQMQNNEPRRKNVGDYHRSDPAMRRDNIRNRDRYDEKIDDRSRNERFKSRTTDRKIERSHYQYRDRDDRDDRKRQRKHHRHRSSRENDHRKSREHKDDHERRRHRKVDDR